MSELRIFDGAMGTLLQGAGMPTGVRPEVFGMQHTELIEAIHRSYIEAGSEFINTNTFGANARKLKGSGYTPAEVVKANVNAAGRASDSKAKVVLDIGPIGDMMEPLGTLGFEEAYDIFSEMVIAGEEAGADIILFETMTDLSEVRAGVLAASEKTNLPIWVTMSFEKDGRTFTGTSAESFAMTMESLPVAAYGINCSLGPKEILPIIERMGQIASKPLIAKPNAGLPDPVTGQYSMAAKSFAEKMIPVIEYGVSVAGGCCGTDPDFIRELSRLKSRKSEMTPGYFEGVCSARQTIDFSKVRVIGERINPTGKKLFQQALRDGNLDYIKRTAVQQENDGADILDINVGLPEINEREMMVKAVKAVQSVSNLPIQIDSSDPQVIEAGLRVCTGRAIVNSVNGDEEKLSAILPIVKKYGAYVVALAMDEKGIPKTAGERFEIIKRICSRAEEEGIPKNHVIADCLTITISAGEHSARETLEAVRMVRDNLGIHCTLGISNISFGLPERVHVNTAFLAMAISAGVDIPIINPGSREMMDVIYSCRALNGNDGGCSGYIRRFSDNSETSGAQKETNSRTEMTISQAILQGLPADVEDITKKLLDAKPEMEVINDDLIPALDVVGNLYENSKIFLPQLIGAANAAGAGFDVIKARLADKGGGKIEKGVIILATVRGDIHDIGKNIVKVVLENYGYRIIDLGKDVAPELIVKTAVSENVALVGLSALMTTTVGAMETTIRQLRESGHSCRVMVGGAVLTEEYAEKIGADFYAKDAKQSADIAKEVFGN